MSQNNVEEIVLKRKNAVGLLVAMIVATIVILLGAITLIISDVAAVGFILIFLEVICMPMIFMGFKALEPNEALVLTLFGKYYGTLSDAGFFYVNPFCASVNPEKAHILSAVAAEVSTANGKSQGAVPRISSKLSLKAITLNNDKQKVNDEDGNPIEIGVIVVWRIKNTAKAVFSVDNYRTFVSSQTDSAIRQVARLHPYDVSKDGDEKSLRGSSLEVAEELKSEVQSRVELAGIEVIEAKIAHLAYAPEIAAAMLQRQQASAIVSARQKIVEGAVGMVQMALEKLSENHICELDAERKAQMVSNLLVVLCGNKDAQPVVGAGSIY